MWRSYGGCSNWHGWKWLEISQERVQYRIRYNIWLNIWMMNLWGSPMFFFVTVFLFFVGSLPYNCNASNIWFKLLLTDLWQESRCFLSFFQRALPPESAGFTHQQPKKETWKKNRTLITCFFLGWEAGQKSWFRSSKLPWWVSFLCIGLVYPGI